MNDFHSRTPDRQETPAEPFRFSLATLLGVMTAVAICCAVVIWSADPIVLPILTGAILFRALFSRCPQRVVRFAIALTVGGLVTLLACLAGWDDHLLGMRTDASFLDFVLYEAPLNALRCYAASGTLAYFLTFHTLRPAGQPLQRIIQVTISLAVLIAATVVVAVIMGMIHYPVGEHH